MDAVTYPDPATVRFVTDSLIAMRIDISSDYDLPKRYQIKYTPTVIVADGEGREHYRTVGFLRPDEFIPAMLLGMARADFNNNRFKNALSHLERILANYSGSQVAGEAGLLRSACLDRI